MENKKEEEIKEKSTYIGLEIHITVNSKWKIFNKVERFIGEEWKNKNNQLISPWELGYIGTLPIINPEIIEIGIKLATILNMKISDYVEFDRKIYPYFDLPKGYQITQKQKLFATDGIFIFFDEKMNEKKVKIKSIHLEEDTAKSYRKDDKILLDFNRSGNPLIEMVTDPIFEETREVKEFIENLILLLKYNEISDANMENGRFRIDANFSFKTKDNSLSSGRYELKNCNSIKTIEEVIKKIKNDFFDNIKENREKEDLTINFDEKKKEIIITRKKKEYFYLPEVNIPPINIQEAILEEKKKNKELPSEIIKKWKEEGEEINYEIITNVELFKILKKIDDNKKTIEKKQFINFYFNFWNLPKFKENVDNYIELFFIWRSDKKKEEAIKKIITEEIEKDADEEKTKIKIFILKKKMNEEDKIDEERENEVIQRVFKKIEIELRKQKKENKRVENFFIGKLLEEKEIKLNKRIIEKIKEIIKYL